MNLVIIDDNKELCKIMIKYFTQDKEINIIGVADNGIDGLKLIKDKKPDSVLMDFVLPQKDGISILESLNEQGLINDKISFIIFTAISTDNVTKKAFELGAKYVMLKPCKLDIVLRRIKEFNPKKIKEFDDSYIVKGIFKVEKFVTDSLNEIGITPNLKGYKYLRSAIIMAFEDDTLMNCITKCLYPAVANYNKTTYTRVERAMRHAIETTWNKGNGINYYKMLGFGENNKSKRPTNSEFVSAMVEYTKAAEKSRTLI